MAENSRSWRQMENLERELEPSWLSQGWAPHLHTGLFKLPVKNNLIRFSLESRASLNGRREILQRSVRWPWGKWRGIWQVLCILAVTAASQEGSPDCLLGSDVPVCNCMKLLIRKPLVPGSANCLFELLSGRRYFLAPSSSLPSNGALATTAPEEQGWQQAITCMVHSLSPCCGGHGRCVTSGCKSRRYPAQCNRKLGACTVVWRKRCHPHSQMVSWNDRSWW